jgi:hypothetical protein
VSRLMQITITVFLVFAVTLILDYTGLFTFEQIVYLLLAEILVCCWRKEQ